MYVNLQENQVSIPFNVAYNDFAIPVGDLVHSVKIDTITNMWLILFYSTGNNLDKN